MLCYTILLSFPADAPCCAIHPPDSLLAPQPNLQATCTGPPALLTWDSHHFPLTLCVLWLQEQSGLLELSLLNDVATWHHTTSYSNSNPSANCYPNLTTPLLLLKDWNKIKTFSFTAEIVLCAHYP